MKKNISSLRDFSGGQINTGARRNDETPEFKTAARIMSDWRIETTESLIVRPGRRLLAAIGAPRAEYARLGSVDYGIAFGVSGGVGQITIYNLATNLPVAANASASYLWTAATVAQIYMCVADSQITICFPGMQPQLAIRAATTGAWTFAPFTFAVATLQSQQPFYRSRNFGATMAWPVSTGSTILTCDQDYFTPAMVGNYLSIAGQQVLITGYIDSTNANVTIQSRLPDLITLTIDDGSAFQVGQIAGLQSDAYTMEVIYITPDGSSDFPNAVLLGGIITSAVIDSYVATTSDVLVSEFGSSPVNGQANFTSGVTVNWQEQFMGPGLGWPQGCAYDQSRLIFFNFPQKPEAVLWSAVGALDTFWVDSSAAALQPDAGASPSSAILEFIPESPQVLHVIGWGDEFVFTDKGVYDIPISAAGNPLQPGSVDFRQFSNDGVSGIVPVKTLDSIVYVNAGLKRASAVIRTGSYTNPYTTDGASELYTDLFTGPVSLAVAPGDGVFPERLIYVLNADGSVIQGKFGEDRKFVGWLPWYPANAASWMFCSGPQVYYCVPLGAGSIWLAEEDSTLYLDDVSTPNAVPATFPAPPAGQGPLWYAAGRTVTLMDGNLDMGDRQVSASGNLVPLDTNDILTSATIVAGFIFTPKLMPFVPEAAPGESMGQRQHRRKISRAMVSVEQSSGFTLGSREFTAYQQGDDGSAAPVLRDVTVSVRPIGRSYDPGCLLSKPRPGPLRVVEYSTEATI